MGTVKKTTQKVGKSGACTRLMIPVMFEADLGLENKKGQEIALETTAGGYRYQKYQKPTADTPDTRFIKKVHIIPKKQYLFFYHSDLVLGDTYSAELQEGWVHLKKVVTEAEK